MDKVILDASVVIKWFFNEEGSNQADLYLERLKNQQITIVITPLLYYEVGNTLISKKVQKDDSDKIVRQLYSLPFEMKEVDPILFRQIIDIANSFNITFYDASYVTLMRNINCEFVTADKKLFEKVHKSFAKVKLLSSLI